MIMSPEHPLWDAFRDALNDTGFDDNPHCCIGPHGGSTDRQPVPFHDTRKILAEMGFSERDIEASIAWFRTIECDMSEDGRIECDCHIITELPRNKPRPRIKLVPDGAIACSVEDVEVESYYSSQPDIPVKRPGIMVTCGRCGFWIESGGCRTLRLHRLLALLRERCPRKESNCYVACESSSPPVVALSKPAVVASSKPSTLNIANIFDGLFDEPEKAVPIE
jgi:hypothetical protein